MAAFRKKEDRVDVHIWLEVRHVATIDALAKSYNLSRAQIIAGLIEEYEERMKSKEKTENVDMVGDTH